MLLKRLVPNLFHKCLVTTFTFEDQFIHYRLKRGQKAFVSYISKKNINFSHTLLISMKISQFFTRRQKLG
jgi:hypothetical protein